jgi:hypothetical protein
MRKDRILALVDLGVLQKLKEVTGHKLIQLASLVKL